MVILTIYRCFYEILFSPIVFSIVFGLSFIICLFFAPVENINNPIHSPRFGGD